MCGPDLRIAALLQESLALWGVDGDTTAMQAEAVRVRGPGGLVASVEPAPEDSPFRWFVRWHDAAAGAAEPRTRPCGSLVGVLAALRRALGVERGTSVRVAPEPTEPGAPVARVAADFAGRSAKFSPADAQGMDEAQGPSTRADGRVPVTLITGFLGSGKTTLLARLLRHPAMGRTAVLVNEFGEIGLDHELVATSDESFVRLSTGCLCCKVRSDLVLTLTDLAARRRSGDLPAFERVVIETSGLAEPAPILHALMTDSALAEAYALAGITTTVDAITGLTTLERHPQSVRQAALADTLVLTKTDVAQDHSAHLETRLRELNREARIVRVVHGDASPADVLRGRADEEKEPGSNSGIAGHSNPSKSSNLAPFPENSSLAPFPALHTAGIRSFGIVRDEPVHAATLALFVSALAENCGEDLLRVKGIVNVAEQRERPAVIHGVQHVYHPPRWLERWPSADRRTRIVFIGYADAQAWACDLLDLLDREVAAQLARTRAGP